MYAIVDIAGKQFKVEKDHYIYTPSLAGEVDSEVAFDKVLLLEDKEGVQVGMPTLKNVKVQGKILAHVKADKVMIFKKRRRKGYKKTQGHRQKYTKVLIQNIEK